jgi:hypothetical protein
VRDERALADVLLGLKLAPCPHCRRTGALIGHGRAELDKAALAHSTFSDDALSLIVRSSEGGLRKARNLCLSALLEAVRDRTKTVELKQVNRVLLQPHWRKEADLPH